jgi:hypothetical protein
MSTLYDEFAGFGGSSQGAAAVPGVELMLAANHNQLDVGRDGRSRVRTRCQGRVEVVDR